MTFTLYECRHCAARPRFMLLLTARQVLRAWFGIVPAPKCPECGHALYNGIHAPARAA